MKFSTVFYYGDLGRYFHRMDWDTRGKVLTIFRNTWASSISRGNIYIYIFFAFSSLTHSLFPVTPFFLWSPSRPFPMFISHVICLFCSTYPSLVLPLKTLHTNLCQNCLSSVSPSKIHHLLLYMRIYTLNYFHTALVSFIGHLALITLLQCSAPLVMH